MAHFYPDRKTVIETDASDFALGCILSQYQGKRLHPVAFHSSKLNDAERIYEIHDKELLAILEAFRKWKHYLLGADEPVTVYTDHQNLQSFLHNKSMEPLTNSMGTIVSELQFQNCLPTREPMGQARFTKQVTGVPP